MDLKTKRHKNRKIEKQFFGFSVFPSFGARQWRGGQVMLITVLALTGTILGATTIAGLLMIYQIRQSTDIVNSTKAIFAADSGIEWRLYRFYKVDDQECNPDCDGAGSGSCQQPEFQNNATLNTTCTLQMISGTSTVVIKSTGFSANNARAFEITLK